MGDDRATFRGPADAYARHVGRYSQSLAQALIARAGVTPGRRVLDVGCGPGGLTAELAAVLGADAVAAVDPSPEYLDACQHRVPGIQARLATGESLPFASDTFDAVLSQLVVNFLDDAPGAMREMQRVTRPGGTVAVAVWDYAGEMWLLRTYWDAALAVDPAAGELDEASRMQYCTAVELHDLFADTGLDGITTMPLVATAEYRDFDDLWTSLLDGGGPAASHARTLSPDAQAAVRARMFERFGHPGGGFGLSARAWSAVGHVPAATVTA